jgi:hypothetical protein
VGLVLLRRRAAPVLVVFVVAAAVQLLPLSGPTLLSTDTWTYWKYGRVGAVESGNPYGDPPSTYPGDVAYAAMGSSWRDTTSLYGPLFTLGSELHARIAGDVPERAAWLFRLVAAVSVLGAAVRPRRSPLVRRSLRHSWAGIRCSFSTSAAAATTTR